MKKKIFLLIGIILIILTVLSLSYIIFREKKEYVDIDYYQLMEKYDNDETFVLFVYQDGCSHCVLVEPKLNNVIDKYRLNIYAINLANLSEEEFNIFYKKTYVNGTPSIIYFKNGALQANKLIGDKSQDQIKTYFKEIGIID